MEKLVEVVERAEVLAERLARAIGVLYGKPGNEAEIGVLAAAGNAVDAWLRKVDAGREVRKGAKVKVVRGRKVPIGFAGVVIWVGDAKYGVRVGIKRADGEVAFTAIGNVEAELMGLPEKPRFAPGTMALLGKVEADAVAAAELAEAA